jgi:hypothetical protein
MGYKLTIPTGKRLLLDRWTPEFISTVAWYDASDADTITLSAGVNISQWDDKSGNDYHLVQPSSGAQPEYVIGGINGRNTVWFESTFNRMWKLGISDIDCSEVCIVSAGMPRQPGDYPNLGFIQNTAVTDSLFLRLQNNDVNGKLSCAANIDGTAYNPAASATTTTIRDNLGCIAAIWYDGFETACRANGGVVSTSNSSAPDGATFTINEIQVGRNPAGGNTPRNYHGEMIVLDTADTDILEKCEGYLAHKWGTADSLPGSHPYKAGPPTI